jgi:hypothetical protein
MDIEEAQKVLDELNGVKPELLNEEAKRLFEAIMKIADERDLLRVKYDRDTHILQNQLDLANAEKIEKENLVNLMAKFISNFDLDEDICKKVECRKYKTCTECIIEFFKKELRKEYDVNESKI